MKKLIYFTIGKNLLFVNLFKMCIETLNNTGYNGDILIITDCKDKIEKQINFINDVYYLELPKCDLLQSSANKFKIYQFEKISDYDKIIYCDADCLWIKNPDLLFSLITENKIYVANEKHLMIEKYYNCNFNEEETLRIQSQKIKGFSAGFFGFNRNCLETFKELDSITQQKPEDAKWLEQPIFVTNIFRKELYSLDFNNFVSHIGRTVTQNNQEFDGVVLHFGGDVGNYFEKYSFMFQFKLKRL